MAYVKFPLIPGVYKDETPLSVGEGGFFTDAQWVRPNRGKWKLWAAMKLPPMTP
jgi:hypothetical protein